MEEKSFSETLITATLKQYEEKERKTHIDRMNDDSPRAPRR